MCCAPLTITFSLFLPRVMEASTSPLINRGKEKDGAVSLVALPNGGLRGEVKAVHGERGSRNKVQPGIEMRHFLC